MEAIGRSKEFETGRIWVWAKINAPRDEVVKLKWIDRESKEILAERDLSIKKNSAGFRTYSWKNIKKPGKYEVQLHNSFNQTIGRQEFAVK